MKALGFRVLGLGHLSAEVPEALEFVGAWSFGVKGVGFGAKGGQDCR